MVRSASSGLKVAARLSPPELDQDQIERRILAAHAGDGGQVDGGVLADGGVRAAAGLHAHDALLGQRAGAHEDQRVLLGVDVVGDGADVVAVAEGLAQGLHQRRLAGADGPADADAQRAVGGFAHGASASRSEQPRILRLVPHGGDVGRDGGAADVVEAGRPAPPRPRAGSAARGGPARAAHRSVPAGSGARRPRPGWRRRPAQTPAPSRPAAGRARRPQRRRPPDRRPRARRPRAPPTPAAARPPAWRPGTPCPAPSSPGAARRRGRAPPPARPPARARPRRRRQAHARPRPGGSHRCVRPRARARPRSRRRASRRL